MTRYKLKPKPIVESVELLNEVTLLKDYNNNVALEVDDEGDRKGNWYFKFFTGTSYERSSNVARIKFAEPVYVVHPYDPRTWTIGRKVIKNVLIPLLLKPYISNKDKLKELTQMGLNNWQAGMYIFNSYMCKWTIPFKKFTTLKRSDDWYDPGFIPIADVIFPDYMNLHYEKK